MIILVKYNECQLLNVCCPTYVAYEVLHFGYPLQYVCLGTSFKI
jgi:hypothetical protein